MRIPLIADQLFTTNLDDLRTTGDEASARPGAGYFQNAHNFNVYHPVFLEVSKSKKTMKLLNRKAIFEALLHSSARSPLPVCLEGTRQEVISRILGWLTNFNRLSNLLWLYGPAGVGKSAIFQTIAKYCKDQGWLGAAFFFPRTKPRHDLTRLIPTLAYQLAVTYSAYKSYVTSLLDHDPSILEGALHVQFEELIAKPLLHMNTERSRPILILLDGLDVCQDDTFQQELVGLISNFAITANASGLPFVWMIASRRERQILSVFEATKPPIHCHREELQIHGPEARADVARYVRYGFREVRRVYGDIFTEEIKWPSEGQLLAIDLVASGFFAFASAIIRFVNADNPEAKLKDCLVYMKDGTSPRGENPLRPLHALYQDILDAIPLDILPTTKRVLSFLALGARDIPARKVCDFLSLGKSTVYASLRRLHSVMDVPALKDAPIYILHSSFQDYLKIIINSGEFDLDTRSIDATTATNIERNCLDLYDDWKMEGLQST